MIDSKPKRKHTVPNYKKGKGVAYAWIVERVGYTGDDCLKWPFANAEGRGMLVHLGKKWRSARLMCTLAHGEPPTPEHEAAHECGNGHLGCMNPTHLSWKTRKENRNDCVRHGTNVRSSGNGSAGKLTFLQAQTIRSLKGKVSVRELAKRYEVSPTAIFLAMKGQTFKAANQLRHPRWSPQEDERLRLATARGMSNDEAAAFVGRSKHHLFQRRAKLGISLAESRRALKDHRL